MVHDCPLLAIVGSPAAPDDSRLSNACDRHPPATETEWFAGSTRLYADPVNYLVRRARMGPTIARKRT